MLFKRANYPPFMSIADPQEINKSVVTPRRLVDYHKKSLGILPYVCSHRHAQLTVLVMTLPVIMTTLQYRLCKDKKPVYGINPPIKLKSR